MRGCQSFLLSPFMKEGGLTAGLFNDPLSICFSLTLDVKVTMSLKEAALARQYENT